MSEPAPRRRKVIWIVLPALVGGLLGLGAGPVIGSMITETPNSLESGFEGFIWGLRLGPPIGLLLGVAIGAWLLANRSAS